VFDGAAPSELHEHYDADGNLTGTTVVTREPEWDDESRAWALALALREDNECRRCGGDMVETLDYDRWKFEPLPPAVCYRCLALAQSRDANQKHPMSAGMIHLAVKKPRPPRKRR